MRRKYVIATGPGHTPAVPIVQLIDAGGHVQHAINGNYILTEHEIEIEEPATRIQLERAVMRFFNELGE